MSSPKSPSAMTASERTRSLSQSSDGNGSHFIGTAAAARRRTSSFGSYTRVVVLGVDTSDHARHAFEWYLENLWKSDDLMILVHCPEAPKLPTFTLKSGINLPVEEWKKILDDMNAKARKIEEDFEATCAQKRLKYKMRIEANKNIGEGILRIAEDESADVIVCGSKIASTGKSNFKGTTCDYVMRNSTKPVVIIPCKY